MWAGLFLRLRLDVAVRKRASKVWGSKCADRITAQSVGKPGQGPVVFTSMSVCTCASVHACKRARVCVCVSVHASERACVSVHVSERAGTEALQCCRQKLTLVQKLKEELVGSCCPSVSLYKP